MQYCQWESTILLNKEQVATTEVMVHTLLTCALHVVLILNCCLETYVELLLTECFLNLNGR